MAETQLKRQREESHEAATSGFDDTDSKRHKSKSSLLHLSLLLHARRTKLVWTISQTTSAECSPSSGGGAKEYEDDDSVRVMIRRLLEASDDELGIPNRVDEEIKSEENRQFDGLWELEDEAANYYTMLQKDLSI
ncbi:uncharacterized protein Fot_33815 [Forsythia ovata]|uniref:Uncharacterized protein n=1 Tax=Forsythia ovata TaxID=205694 RepID=A0ABD1TC89_9LAMI